MKSKFFCAATLLALFTGIVSAQSSGSGPGDSMGYQKVVRPRSSLWRNDECDVTLPTLCFRKYLRFYRDGLVIDVTSSGNPKSLKNWFRRPYDKAYNSSGSYVIDGNNIKFSTTSDMGTVEYEGIIEGDKLILKSHSKINGYKALETYRWIQPYKR